MIYLVTGMPGNGKTLYAVEFIKKAVEKGRKVYTDQGVDAGRHRACSRRLAHAARWFVGRVRRSA
ncbi:zonular occludens toxin domain-containing protein [Xanthomonas campestris]|uniref:zonular occludens toxin domain-containing protein n=1 Tax=Xanthomonas campestris TaxID=339 RepID=UPI0012FD74F0